MTALWNERFLSSDSLYDWSVGLTYEKQKLVFTYRGSSGDMQADTALPQSLTQAPVFYVDTQLCLYMCPCWTRE